MHIVYNSTTETDDQELEEMMNKLRHTKYGIKIRQSHVKYFIALLIY